MVTHRAPLILLIIGVLVYGAVIVLQVRRKQLAGGRLIAAGLAWTCFAVVALASIFHW